MRITSLVYYRRLSRLFYLIVLFFSFTRNAQAQQYNPCNCSSVLVYDEKGPYNSTLRLSGYGKFQVDAPSVFSGRFVIFPSGKVGIGTGDDETNTLAQFHLKSGTTIWGGNTLISGNAATQSSWATGTSPNSKDANWGLWVDKGVVATDYAITTSTSWADFVFEPNYRLRSLTEVERFIKANRHLPEIPSAVEIKKKGYTLQDMNSKFMQKIEELTLYTIEEDKKSQEQGKQIELLQKQLQELASQVKALRKASETKK